MSQKLKAQTIKRLIANRLRFCKTSTGYDLSKSKSITKDGNLVTFHLDLNELGNLEDLDVVSTRKYTYIVIADPLLGANLMVLKNGRISTES